MANKWSAISWIHIEICIYIDTNKYNLIQMLKIIMQMHVVINEYYPFEKASIHKHYYLVFHVGKLQHERCQRSFYQCRQLIHGCKDIDAHQIIIFNFIRILFY